jgi:hypothetical protein
VAGGNIGFGPNQISSTSQSPRPQLTQHYLICFLCHGWLPRILVATAGYMLEIIQGVNWDHRISQVAIGNPYPFGVWLID